MKMEERRKERTEIFRGHILHVFRDKVILPDGKEASREVIEHNGAVCVLPLMENGKVYLVRQYRYAVGRELLELPAGKIDGDEAPLTAAVRELKEETGYTAEKWTFLGKFLPSAGYTNEVITCYLAQGLSAGDVCPDEGEFLEGQSISMQELMQMVQDNIIQDGKTAFAVLQAARKLNL